MAVTMARVTSKPGEDCCYNGYKEESECSGRTLRNTSCHNIYVLTNESGNH